MRPAIAVALLAGLLAGVAHSSERSPRAGLLLDEDEEQLDKKASWLMDKARRQPPLQATPPAAPDHPLSLHNMWTDEILPLSPRIAPAIAAPAFDALVRCHYTQAATVMAPRLLDVVRSAAAKFHAPLVEIVSGYRAPKYQLMLRKKGHEVARDSAHPRGEAVDFRLPEVATDKLHAFVRRLRAGGVGYYPVSRFVHTDVGPIRYWRGK